MTGKSLRKIRRESRASSARSLPTWGRRRFRRGFGWFRGWFRG
jgi:hypothetical protein